MKYCPNCGVAVEEGQKFCGECGAKLDFEPLPAEPVYTEDERLKNDPRFNAGQNPAPKPKGKEKKVPELTLEPDLWGFGGGAAAAAAEPEPGKKEKKTPELTLEPDVWGHSAAAAAQPAEPAKPAAPAEAAAAAVAAQPAAQADSAQIARPVQDFDYEQPGAEYHGPAQGTQGDYQPPRAERYDTLPNDYTMSQGRTPAFTEKKMPDETLMLIWSILLTCFCSVCGVVGLIKTIKARKTMNNALKYKLLSSAKIWLIVGTALHVLPFLAELF